MSVNIIHSTQGICNYQFVKQIKNEGNISYFCRFSGKLKCPCCGSTHVLQRGINHQSFLGVPFGSTIVHLEMDIPKIFCKECQTTRTIETPFAKKYKRYTKKFQEYVISLIGFTTCSDLADMLKVSWDTIRDIEKEYLKKNFSHPDLSKVRRIAIDEIAVKKGHNYLTIVLDLDVGNVIHVGEGKGGNALKKFWKRLKKSGAKIECVSMDLSPAYTAAVEKELSDSVIVYDHFHVIKLFNDMLTKARRELYNKLPDKEQKAALKGIRYLLLKRPENLNPAKDEPERLQKALEMNDSLMKLYYLKDDFNEVWDQENYEKAEEHLLDWLRYAESLKITALTAFCKNIRRHAIGIISWYDYLVSSGPLEGLNNKIKTLKRKAYGYRNMEMFKLKILAIHKAKYQLVG